MNHISKNILVLHDMTEGPKTKITSHGKQEAVVKVEKEKRTGIITRGTEAEVGMVTAREKSTTLVTFPFNRY